MSPRDNDTVQLFRPVGPQELLLIEVAKWKKFPPRLPEQPIFYPVLTESYAIQIARDWNARHSGAGIVTRFVVPASVLERYPPHLVGGSEHTELWVPAEELEAFNASIVGSIEIVAGYCRDESGTVQTIAEFIASYADASAARVAFDLNGKLGGDCVDANYAFRKWVSHEVLAHPEVAPLALVRDLYLAETELSGKVWAVDHHRVAGLAEVLLSRGGIDAIEDFLRGLRQGQDAFIASMSAPVVTLRGLEFADYCAKRAAECVTDRELWDYVGRTFRGRSQV